MRSRFCLIGLLFFGLHQGQLEAVTIAKQSIIEGRQMDIRFAVPPYFQEYAAQGGNPKPALGRVVLVFPKGFQPSRAWPILIVTSTTDGHRTSPMDVDFYQRAALAEGWIVLASDALIKPKLDSSTWRVALTAASLEVLRAEWPQSEKWPVAFAGLSGGAKRSGVIGAMLSATGSLNIRGFFLAGINDDRLGAAYKEVHPSAELLNVPVWLSSGMNDRIATPRSYSHVKTSLELTGFKHVRLEQFPGGHEVSPPEVQRALRWFRELGGF